MIDIKIISFSVFFVLLIGCKEKGPLIDFGSSTQSTDTTYMASPETPMSKNVLIEEFTGVSCPPCPGGHDAVASIRGQYPARIIVIANHVFNFPQAAPVAGVSKNDFRTQFATDLGSYFGGVSAMPQAVIDRVPDNANAYLQGRGVWSDAVANRINTVPPLNLYLTSTYDETQRKAKLKLKIAYTKDINIKHNLTIAITESNIIDAQENGLKIDTFYTHNYVLRNIITLTTGTSILDSIPDKKPGRVIERIYDIDIDPAWNVNNCKAVAFVHYNGTASKEVLQVVETSVKQ